MGTNSFTNVFAVSEKTRPWDEIREVFLVSDFISRRRFIHVALDAARINGKNSGLQASESPRVCVCWKGAIRPPR